jgi:hypothetical protein
VHAIPIGDAAYRMNLLSAVMAATAVGLVYAVIRSLGPGRLAATAAALLFAVGDAFWSQAVITEVYTANLALQSATMLVLLAWARRTAAGVDGAGLFLGFALLFGVSLGTHLSNLGFAPCYALFVLLVDPRILRRPGLIAGAFAVFLFGAAQYGWLVVRGSTFDQYPNLPPIGLRGLWGYTFGAFASARFAYAFGGLGLRLVFYLQQLARNFTIAGVAVGMLGAWVLLRRRPYAFWLVFGMHVTNVFVFGQFKVPDPEVFFLPGYVPWAIFVGCGIQALLDASARVAAARVSRPVVAVALALAIAWLGARTFRANDRTLDTLVPDFDQNVYDLLPPESAVLAPRGAFGANMVFWQRAGLRPDVRVLGQRETPPWDERQPLYSVLRVVGGEPTSSARMGRRDADFPANFWYVPVLFGNARGMILSRVDRQPPVLVADAPAATAGRRLGPVTLVDARAVMEPQASASRLHVQTRWRVPNARRVVVATRLGDRTLESHTLGLENLARYADVVGLPPDAVVQEDFRVVVPSTMPSGTYDARVGVTTFAADGIAVEWLDVGRVDLP